MKNNIKIGITIGDANGIGPEIIIKTFLQYKTIRDQTIIIYSSVEIIEYYLQILKHEIKESKFILKEVLFLLAFRFFEIRTWS